MREEFMIALRRDSVELERDLVDQRVDAAFERVYQDPDSAAEYLRSVLDRDGLRAFKQYELAMLRALKHAARSGIGCTGTPRLDLNAASHATIPVAPPPAEEPLLVTAGPEPDQVLRVGFRG